MGWIWVLFLLFSVLGNIMEKLVTEQKPAGSDKPSKEGEQPLPPGKPFSFPIPPFLMGDLEEESGPTESLPKMKPDLTPLSEGKIVPAKLTGHPQEQGGLMADEEWERLFDQQDEFDEEDLRTAYYMDADEVEKLEDPNGREIGPRLLYDALILAHALPRPDFRTVPWRRRP